VVVEPGRRWAADLDPAAVSRPGRPARFAVRKPRLPWTYTPRSFARRTYTECGGPRIYHDKYATAAGLAAAIKKACGPKKTRREFDAGGPEAGTLAGARRVVGLFDFNWDREFPLTKKERVELQATGDVLDAFFQPPTTPDPGNWVDDKLKRIRGTFGPTLYQTPKAYSAFCPDGGFAISCAGPDGEVGWRGGQVALTPLDVARFKDAYCAPGQCQTGGKIEPPAGYKEFVVKVAPRNPAVRLKASCQAVLAPEPVIQDVKLSAPAAPPAAPPSWQCPPAFPTCIRVACNYQGVEHVLNVIPGTPPEFIRAWLVANCGWPP